VQGAVAREAAQEPRREGRGEGRRGGRGDRENQRPEVEPQEALSPTAFAETQPGVPAPLGETAEGQEQRERRRRRRRGGRDRGDAAQEALSPEAAEAGVSEEEVVETPSLETAEATAAEPDAAEAGNREEGSRRRGRGRDRYRRDRREGEQGEAGERPVEAGAEAETGEALVPATVWTPPVTEAAPASDATAPVAPQPVQPVQPVQPPQPFVLPEDELAAMARAAGLEWVGSDADKVRSVQQAMASEPRPNHVPRERKPVVLVDEGPLVLVETRKDLSQIQLPFEAGAQPAAAQQPHA
jgi:ribonuclease E